MICETKKIKISTGEYLNCKIWENGSPVWIIVTHGLGEHCERHQYFLKLFSQYFNICLYDLRGHGKSDGKRAYIENFDFYQQDLNQVINYIRKTYEMKRYVLFGHSLGGLITASYMQNVVDENFYPEKVFLSGPASGGAGMLGSVIANLPPVVMQSLSKGKISIPLAGMLDIKKLSHDPIVYNQYVNDPLCSLKIHSKTFFQILAQAQDVFSRPLRVKCDLFCAVGTADVLVDHKRTVEYFQTIEKNAKLFIVEGGYHELHNEIEKYSGPYFKFLKDSIMDSIYVD